MLVVMPDVNEPPRSRKEQAAATRQRILDASKDLFAEHGYAGTTMQAIADRAGVAVQTVYFVFHTKGELLRQLLHYVGGRPGDPIETEERDWIREAMTHEDGRRSIALMAEHGTDIYARIAPFTAAIGQGASVEPEVDDVWNAIVERRRQGIHEIVESLDARGHLRDGLTVDRAADIVYAVHRPETFAVLVDERGWSLNEFKAWAYALLCQQLLAAPAPTDEGPSPTRDLAFDEALSRAG